MDIYLIQDKCFTLSTVKLKSNMVRYSLENKCDTRVTCVHLKNFVLLGSNSKEILSLRQKIVSALRFGLS